MVKRKLTVFFDRYRYQKDSTLFAVQRVPCSPEARNNVSQSLEPLSETPRSYY